MENIINQGFASSPNNFPNKIPDSYLVWAILTTLFCCLPTGIYAIIKATKVESLWLQGRYAESLQASNDAKRWSIIGAIIGVVIGFIYAVAMFIAGATGAL